MVSFQVDSKTIKDYYGENIAVYFEWLNYYLRWLMLPAIVSLLFFLASQLLGLDLKKNYLYGVYAFGITIWGPLFCKYWKRKANTLQVRWKNFHSGVKRENIRKEYYAEEEDQASDIINFIDPDRVRHMKYVMSLVKSAPFILLAILIMICGLNAMGYVEKGVIFHIWFIADLSEPGGIFEKGTLYGVIPSVLQTVIMG